MMLLALPVVVLMGMDLTSETGATLSPTGTGWSFYLRLAEAYGWKPAGTLAPKGAKPKDWKGTYDSNDGQTVTKEDAAAMAAALERVLSDPNGEARQREVNRKLNEDVRELAKKEYGIDLPPDADDDEIAAAEDIRALVQFLRSGSFTIE